MDILKFKNGWMGGKYTINDVEFITETKPKATLIINGKRYKAVYKNITGTDDDHGHTYPWTKTHIGIMDGILKKRFLPIAGLTEYTVYIEKDI